MSSKNTHRNNRMDATRDKFELGHISYDSLRWQPLREVVGLSSNNISWVHKTRWRKQKSFHKMASQITATMTPISIIRFLCVQHFPLFYIATLPGRLLWGWRHLMMTITIVFEWIASILLRIVGGKLKSENDKKAHYFGNSMARDQPFPSFSSIRIVHDRFSRDGDIR
jgi:hypothetical protein